MLKNTTVVTFAGSPVHEVLQDDFNTFYSRHFYQSFRFTGDLLKNTDFYKENPIFKYQKYFGYFLWKPYIILQALKNTTADYVLYCDSNMRFKDIQGFASIYNLFMEQDGMFLVKHKDWINKDWTKRDTFVLMGADEERFWNAHQCWSVIMGFSRSEKSIGVLEDFLYFCQNENILTELPNICGKENLPGFRDHRWDQSIISILAERNNVNGPWDFSIYPYADKIYNTQLINQKAEESKLDPLRKE